MDIQKAWEKALKHTEIIRSRIHSLSTFSNTRVPYIFLAESAINVGDTVVRKGEVIVQKPSIILPPNSPQFEGFEFDVQEDIQEESIVNYLLVRGVTLPSLRYNNHTFTLDVCEKKLSDAIKSFRQGLEKKEDVHTGLITGYEDCWQFSILIFICSQIVRNATADIKHLTDEFKKQAE